MHNYYDEYLSPITMMLVYRFEYNYIAAIVSEHTKFKDPRRNQRYTYLHNAQIALGDIMNVNNEPNYPNGVEEIKSLYDNEGVDYFAVVAVELLSLLDSFDFGEWENRKDYNGNTYLYSSVDELDGIFTISNILDNENFYESLYDMIKEQDLKDRYISWMYGNIPYGTVVKEMK